MRGKNLIKTGLRKSPRRANNRIKVGRIRKGPRTSPNRNLTDNNRIEIAPSPRSKTIVRGKTISRDKTIGRNRMTAIGRAIGPNNKTSTIAMTSPDPRSSRIERKTNSVRSRPNSTATAAT